MQEHNNRQSEENFPKIDLHGYYVHEALAEVERFMRLLAPTAGSGGEVVGAGYAGTTFKSTHMLAQHSSQHTLR